MTSEYFEESVSIAIELKAGEIAYSRFSLQMGDLYKPRNIELIRFEPNMTLFVQPLDVGIIRCFKAHYQKAFCMGAKEMDEAKDENISDINLLEVMLMVNEAWDAVSAKTIENYWNHTSIQGSVLATVSFSFLLIIPIEILLQPRKCLSC